MNKEIPVHSEHLCRSCAVRRLGKLPKIPMPSMGTCGGCGRFKAIARIDDFKKTKLL